MSEIKVNTISTLDESSSFDVGSLALFPAQAADLTAAYNTLLSSYNSLSTTVNTQVVKQDSATGSAIVPSGTTAQRTAAPTVGNFRFNTTTLQYEGYKNSQWLPLIDDATQTTKGVSRASTNTEVQTGAAGNNLFVTPSGLASRTATETRAGLTEKATQTEVNNGTAGNLFVAPETLATRIAALPFTKEWTSSAQTVTSAGNVVLTHTLGAVPKIVNVDLVFVNDYGGFLAGDVVNVAYDQINAGSTPVSGGISIIKTSSNLTINYGSRASVFQIVRADTGGIGNISNADVNMVVSAYA